MKNVTVLLLALAVTGASFAQQPAPTPASERVVVPSLPDQPNKEGVVKPSGAMKTDAEGYVKNDAKPVEPQTAPPAGAGGATARPAPGPGIGAPALAPAPPAGPKEKTVVEATHLTLRGVVKEYEKGVSITITEANGKVHKVPLAEKAAVYEGVAAGDKVALSIPLKKPADGKSTDRVEKQKSPKAPPKSKFSQAQSPKS